MDKGKELEMNMKAENINLLDRGNSLSFFPCSLLVLAISSSSGNKSTLEEGESDKPKFAASSTVFLYGRIADNYPREACTVQELLDNRLGRVPVLTYKGG